MTTTCEGVTKEHILILCHWDENPGKQQQQKGK